MGRRRSEWESPLRQHWQGINRHNRQAQAELRAKRKASDKKRAKCRCDAYKFPHRPGGGLCRFPDPPAMRWQDAQAAETAERVAKFRKRWGEPTEEQMADLSALTTKQRRRYSNRYAGILRQLARKNGLHPIRDRALIQDLLPQLISAAKRLKRQCSKAKYRNMEIVQRENGGFSVVGAWQTAGPLM